ncbi:MAG: TonB-dependent receptor [Gammaproteobacteria bacterium]
MSKKLKYLVFSVIFFSVGAFAQSESASDVEELVVVGSQIKGAKITDALPVSILSSEDIDILGVSDGEDLVNNLVEQGMNYFNENEQTSGGVNAARGDTGAYNLRNMGVGNTLSLLNGRRLVNNAGYQTEFIGGSFVPTMTANTNSIPVNALARVEVLKDGASAIYGADAVAGVINNVLDDDYEGFQLQIKRSEYDLSAAQDHDLNMKFGKTFNGGKTNVSVYFNYRDRDPIMLSEDARWAAGDYRTLLPAGSPWAGISDLNNTYGYPMMQLDISGTRGFTDSAGETQLFPSGSPECSRSTSVDTGFGSCLAVDTAYSFAPQAYRNYRAELQRTNLFVFINHEMENGMEMFAEIGTYNSETNRTNEAAAYTAGIIGGIPASYYWFSQVPGFDTNKSSVRIDGWRPFHAPRTVNVQKEDYRLLLGFRGTFASGWDWETAFVDSDAKSNDVTSGRVSYPALKAALSDTTSAAFNIFDPNNATNNIDRILVDVYRKDSSGLTSWDFKMSNPSIATLPAGDVAALVGFEWRKEDYEDNRDPLLDGTVVFPTASPIDSHPYRAAIMGSSATEDVKGDKTVKSLFVELQVPLTETINAQIAGRHENFSDSDSATVYKFAIGWDVTDWMLFRASQSTSFRPPNLVQVNQERVARNNTRVDALLQYVITENGLSKSTSGFRDWDFGIIRFAEGATGLKPEESTNSSFGVVLQPSDGLTVTFDVWEIEKENTIGLFGENNWGVADLLARLRSSDGCTGESAVKRNASDWSAAEEQYFTNLGLCPVGRTSVIGDEYLNLATRTLEGRDLVVYYDIESSFGDFRFTYSNSETTKFDQVPTGDFNELQAAFDSGELPAYIALTGFGDQIQNGDGFFTEKETVKFDWSYGNYGATVSTLKIGSFIDAGMKLADGTSFKVPSMSTTDASVYYNFKWRDAKGRIKFAVKNIDNERAPIADGYNGFFSDVHSDLGKNYYVDLTLNF